MAAQHDGNQFAQSIRSSSTAGNLARELSLPQAESPRPARKPRSAPRKRGKGFVIGVFWMVTLAVSMLLVHQNSLVLREKAAITATRAELARTEKKNQEQEALLVQLTSVSEIERWALAQNMQRPASAKVLTPDPTAVARKPASLQLATDGVVQQGSTGIWSAVKGYVSVFAGLFSTTGAR